MLCRVYFLQKFFLVGLAIVAAVNADVSHLFNSGYNYQQPAPIVHEQLSLPIQKYLPPVHHHLEAALPAPPAPLPLQQLPAVHFHNSAPLAPIPVSYRAPEFIHHAPEFIHHAPEFVRHAAPLAYSAPQVSGLIINMQMS